MTKYLVTGAAGFIGYHASERLLARGDADDVSATYPAVEPATSIGAWLEWDHAYRCV